MVSEKAKAFLKKKYGDQYFGWNIEDRHLKEFLNENRQISYEDLNRKCTDLENLIRETKELLEKMRI